MSEKKSIPETSSKEIKYEPVIPPKDGDPWTILRFRLSQHKRVLPAITSDYHFYFSPNLLGYAFVQANPKELAEYLLKYYIPAVCIFNTLTLEHVLLSDSQTLLYKRVIDDPISSFTIVPHPLEFYAQNREKLVCVHGPLKGLTGYVVRIRRDRKFIFRLDNNFTFSASNIQQSSFLTLAEYSQLPQDQQVLNIIL